MGKKKMSTGTIIQIANNTKSLLFLNLGAVAAFLFSMAANALNSVGAFLGKAPLIGSFLQTLFRFIGGFIRVPCYVVIAIVIIVDVLLLLKFLLPFLVKLFRKIFRRNKVNAVEEEVEEIEIETTKKEENGETLQVNVKEGEELHLF